MHPGLSITFTISRLPRLDVTVDASLFLSEPEGLLRTLEGSELQPKLLLTCWGLNVFLLTPSSLPSMDLLVAAPSQWWGQQPRS